jgi:hypothetical protein
VMAVVVADGQIAVGDAAHACCRQVPAQPFRPFSLLRRRKSGRVLRSFSSIRR